MATPLPNELPQGEAKERMHRVRVGVTGLASVVLLLALAGAISAGIDRRARDMAVEPPIVTTTIGTPSNVADPQEPLAQLGVAPDAKRDEPAPKPPAR